MPVFSYRLSIALIERALGDAGYIKGPAIMPLALNSWLVIGFLNELHDASGFTVDQEAMQSSSISSSANRYILRTKATNTKDFPSTDDEQSSDEDSSSDKVSSASGEGCFIEEDKQPSVRGKKIRWSPFKDARLQKYVRDN